ncbi:MAG: glycosyltransferase family 4 protein [Paracoccaceae bacterium]|nr:glycosyltransferase family 4 protein [Paracoccaceae bacterium]
MTDPDTPLRVAYLCDFDPFDQMVYSGGNARLFAALKANVDDVHVLDNGWGRLERVNKRIRKLPHSVELRLRWRAHLAMSPVLARHVERQLAQGDYDVLFGAYSFHSMCGVRVPDGMVTAYTSDATPTIYKRSPVGQSFGSFIGVSRLLDPAITRAERATFRKTDLLLWASDWLHEEAVDLYGLDPDQSHVVNWGANIDPPAPEAAPLPIAPDAPLRLLFVGRDWAAKGGPTTVAVLRMLRAQGIDARLSVVGTEPPPEDMDDAIDVYRFLDKSDPAQLALFTDLYRTAHFMVMLSFESYGFAYCEASAYGLPSLAMRVAGVPVREGVNGHAFAIGTAPEELANRIQAYLADPASYAALRLATRTEYEERLNWDAWGRRTAALLRAKVAARRALSQGRDSAQSHANRAP